MHVSHITNVTWVMKEFQIYCNLINITMIPELKCTKFWALKIYFYYFCTDKAVTVMTPFIFVYPCLLLGFQLVDYQCINGELCTHFLPHMLQYQIICNKEKVLRHPWMMGRFKGIRKDVNNTANQIKLVTCYK